MTHCRILAATFALALSAGVGHAQTQPPIPLGSGILAPRGIALDGAGNVFIADNSSTAVEEIVASGGGVTVRNLAGAAEAPRLFAVDGQGGIISVTDNFKQVQRVTVGDGTVTARSFGTGLDFATGVAVNAAGDVFVADPGANTI